MPHPIDQTDNEQTSPMFDQLLEKMKKAGTKALELECGHMRLCGYNHHGYIICTNSYCREESGWILRKVVWITDV